MIAHDNSLAYFTFIIRNKKKLGDTEYALKFILHHYQINTNIEEKKTIMFSNFL